MKWSHVSLVFVALDASIARYISSPFPAGSENPVVALMALDAPVLLWLAHGWYAAHAGCRRGDRCARSFPAYGGFGSRRLQRRHRARAGCRRGRLPTSDENPAIVVGETHHPVEAREVPNPEWLVIPERGLYTGIAIFGAVGSGKTSACMHPFARQLLGWQATNPERRAAALILEVKGDFCYDIREILKKAGREDDYMELGMGGKWQWNPLAAHWLDSYSLAYTVSSLLNQLFGKGKDPFWQQAYTNLVKWIIELHRIFPDRWVTLQDVYRCAINPELFKQKIGEAVIVVETQANGAIVVSADEWAKREEDLLALGPWVELPGGEYQTPWRGAAAKWLHAQGASYSSRAVKAHTDTDELGARLESVNTWYEQDWMKLDPKLRTSCVEGISSFLSLFDMADVAPIFCPKAPPVKDEDGGAQKPRESGEDGGEERTPTGGRRPIRPGCGGIFHPWTN